MTVLAILLPLYSLQIGLNHLLDQVRKAGAMLPAQLLLRLCGVAQQAVDLRRAKVARIDLDQDLARRRVGALFLDACDFVSLADWCGLGFAGQVREIPAIGYFQTFFEPRRCRPAERAQAAHVQELPWGAVRFRGIKGEFALVADDFGDQMG